MSKIYLDFFMTCVMIIYIKIIIMDVHLYVYIPKMFLVITTSKRYK